MHAPSGIIGYLESILGIFLSDIRHKERSTYILCDNSIEICCKARIKERNPVDTKQRNFPDSIKDSKLPAKLIAELSGRHKIRNDMQHEKLGITVDIHECADSILGLIKVINKLWGKYALNMAPEWVGCALKIVALYSTSSDSSKRVKFEKTLLKDIDWSKETNEQNITSKRLPNKNEMIIEVGAKNYWVLIVREKTQIVTECLDNL